MQEHIETKKQDKKILWYSLAFMAFSSVWGFANIVNGYSEQDGLKSITSWIVVFVLYFLPYALIVGELGSAFKGKGGGVSSWIHETIGAKMAYYAGWSYWIVHMPYISQKPNTVLIAAGWTVFQDNRMSDLNTVVLQFLSLLLFFVALFIASKGMGPIKALSSLAGSTTFIMSILYILLMMAAPAITQAPLNSIDWSFSTFLPNFNIQFFTSLSIFVLAVGGCEKISPYVNKMDNPSKNFPKGMIALSVMIGICAILGTLALGMMFDTNHIPDDLMTNGAYYAFQMLGEYYHVGNSLVVIYALTNLIGQFSVLILSIDAPLRMLLESSDEAFIPKSMFKKNKHGAYINGQKLVMVIASVLIIVPAFGIGSVDEMVRWLIKLNAVCMPLRYLWVFVAYIALKKASGKFTSEYKFIKNKKLGIAVGGWCFLFTAMACIFGMFTSDPFQLIMNVLTPIVLIALGMIMPKVARRDKDNK